jgi:signal transduction histidine kinase
MRWPARQSAGYIAVLVVCLAVSVAAGWTTFGLQIDSDAYDFLFRLHPAAPGSPESVILAADERSLMELGGLARLREMVAAGLESVAPACPKTVVVDLILADPGEPAQDARLEAAFGRCPNLVLACDLVPGGWEDPIPRFRRRAAAVGHAHADPDEYDNVTRRLPLEKAAGRDRRWALSLEAFRLSRGAPHITETPDSLETAGTVIPAPRRRDAARPLLLRFLQRDPEAVSAIPLITLAELRRDPALAARVRGKAVFVGVTAQSAADDRHMTAYSAGRPMPGIEIHATAFETLARGRFLRPAPDSSVLLFCFFLAAAAGVTFHYRSGWASYLMGGALVGLAHLLPYALFRADIVFPYASPVGTAWLSVAGAATYQHFVVRRMLRRSEGARERYQQAIHFVTHEMRTPLTAIQGSSELMGRYNLPEEKGKQLAQMINAESKRLARLIQTFLDVERLTAGQMELKRDPFDVDRIVDTCLGRVRPLAERKRITVRVEALASGSLVGDRELMEYAVYNLLNNAVKYSPAETEITVSGARDGNEYRLSVRDQGIGMDEQELRSIFRKFYRTRRAEASGEAGTGIGLSIVDQIVTHHGGRIEVASRPGAGSCFTVVLPVPVAAGPARGGG